MLLQVTVAEVVHAVQPGMRSAIIMREPLSRMYSAYWYYGCMYGNAQSNLSPERFHEAAKSDVAVVRQCLEKGGNMRRCARESFGPAQQLVKGMYAAFAPDWLAAWPKEQLLWIRAEDYYADERGHLEVRLCRCCMRRFDHAPVAARSSCILKFRFRVFAVACCTSLAMHEHRNATLITGCPASSMKVCCSCRR